MLDALLYPKAVAVMGASRTPGKVGYAVVANLIQGGFEGDIVPINPSGGELLGHKIYAGLEEYGKQIDLSVIAVPTAAVKGAVISSLHQGAKAIVVITAGFKEVGEEGARLEKEIADLCHASGARLMGPNCLGLINTHHAMNASFASHMPAVGGISVVSQSGALCTAILDWAASRKMGLATLVSIGNKADLDETDFLSAFADDDRTKVIVGYLESIGSGDEFIRVAESVAAIKPVVILKAGTTSAGSKAASSHTGALAGADIAYGAAFKRAGIIRADTFESLFDFSAALAMQPLPKGDRVAIITNAGGPGIMTADAVENSGMKVASLHPDTADDLREKLPAAASVGNPIDVLGDADPERYAMAVEAAQNDPSVDAVIVILTPQAMTRPAETARAIAAKANGEKPLLASFMGGSDVLPGREELVAANLPDYPSPERAVASLKAMVDYAAWRLRPPRIVTRFPVNRRRVERIISRQLRTGRLYIGEAKAKDILRAYDFVVPDGRLVGTVEEAMEAAPRIGYPLAMKIVSPDIIHKSDVGGVKLNLNSAGGRGRRVRTHDAAHQAAHAGRLPRGRVPREDGAARPGGHPGHDPRPAVRPHAHVRAGRHLRGGHEGRHLPPGPHHLGGSHEHADGHPLLQAPDGRARRGRREPGGHRRGAAAHQPAGHRLPADRRTRHQPLHRRQDGRRVVGGRRPNPAGPGRCAMTPEKPIYDADWQSKYASMIMTAEQAVSADPARAACVHRHRRGAAAPPGAGARRPAARTGRPRGASLADHR